MMPSAIVCVPARNEAQRLPGLLAALARQTVRPQGVVVTANNCTDETAGIARHLADQLGLRVRVQDITWPADDANVGRARRSAMDTGVAWLRAEGGEGILISTDADAVPPPRWIESNLDAVREGATIVGGAIRLLQDEPRPDWLATAQARVAAYWQAVRQLAVAIDPLPHDPPPHHGDHTGASLAITTAAYCQAGGIPTLRVGEDIALVDAVERQGGRLRHSPSVWVEVSAREDGRAPGGMAAEMRAWRNLATSSSSHLLPDADFWREHFDRRHHLRRMFREQSFSAYRGAAPNVLRELAARCVNDIAFVANAAPRLTPQRSRLAECRDVTRALLVLAGNAAT